MSQQDDIFCNFLLEDDDESEEQFGHFFIFLAVITSRYQPSPRFYIRNRIEWEVHANELLIESPQSLHLLYWICLPSFKRL